MWQLRIVHWCGDNTNFRDKRRDFSKNKNKNNTLDTLSSFPVCQSITAVTLLKSKLLDAPSWFESYNKVSIIENCCYKHYKPFPRNKKSKLNSTEQQSWECFAFVSRDNI